MGVGWGGGGGAYHFGVVHTLGIALGLGQLWARGRTNIADVRNCGVVQTLGWFSVGANSAFTLWVPGGVSFAPVHLLRELIVLPNAC